MDGEAGQLVWSETYSTLHNEKTVAGAADASGNLYTVGRAFGDGFYDMVVQCFHGDFGTQQWFQSIASPAILDDVGWDIAVDSQGYPVALGIIGTSLSTADAVVVKYDPAFGEQVWRVDIPGAIYNIESIGGWIAVADNDDLIVGMRVWDSTTGYDVLLKRLAAADGEEIWSQRWNSGGTTADDPRAMTLSPLGEVVFAGVTGGDYLAAGFDLATGSYRWHGTYAGPPAWYDVGTCVGVAPDGQVVVSGYSDGTSTGWDVATVGFDPADGSVVWSERFDGYALSDEARALAVGPDGSVAVVGYAYSYDHGNDALAVYYAAETTTATPVLPGATRLASAYPNPFNPSVTLAYRLAASGPVRLDVYDARGRLVDTLVSRTQAAGDHTVRWDGTDRQGRSLPSGVYLAVMTSADGTSSRKLVLAE